MCLQLRIGDNRFNVTPERWLPSANFTGLHLLIVLNISRNAFSGTRPLRLPALRQLSILGAPTHSRIAHNGGHPACTLLARSVGSFLYLHTQARTKHSLHSRNVSM